MQKVKVLVSIASAEWSYVPGQIVEMPADQAATWVASGLAEPLAPVPAPAPPTIPKAGKKR
jgi:hypothetical protein